MIPADFKYSTLGGPDRDYTSWEAWRDQTDGVLIFGEWLDVYCDEIEATEFVLSGAATSKTYHRIIRLIGDSRKVTVRVDEANSYIIRLYDVLCWIEDCIANPARPQEGHVVDIRPHGQPWGTEEERLFIVVPIEMSGAEAAELKKQRYKGGVDGQAIAMQIIMGDTTLEQPEFIHLCSHRLPLAKLMEKKPDLDIAKLRDPKERYQPFLKAEPVFSTSDKTAIFYNEEKAGFKFKSGAVPIRLAEVI